MTTTVSAARAAAPPAPAGNLEVRNVSKAFPNVQALSDVSLDIRPGEILAFMGENGAGKSTLLKIINGDYQPDSGTLTLDGRRLNFSGPSAAHAAGIRVIYQEPEIIPGVDVAENIWVGELPKRFGLLDRGQLNRQVRHSLVEYGFEDVLPMNLLGEQLSSAQRQVVEIMRALKEGVRVLALDEPTSSLTDEEVDRLFELVRRLRDEGVAIIYVSHRIKEILQLCDRVAILRDGRLVAVRPAAELNDAEIVRLMVGRELTDVFQRRPSDTGREVLRAEGIHSNWHRNVSFSINAGEVVGFAGLVGAGRTELAKVIFGELPKRSGSVLLEGRAVTIRRPDDAIAKGIGFAPEDRKREGLVLIRSVLENASLAILPQLSRFHFVRRGLERSIMAGFVDKLRVRTPSLEQEVGKLSGGNQQKVVLARWLAARPKVLILDEPTRGIDVGAKAEIYRLVDDLANQGLGIMFISSELPELLGLADRIYVMQNGRITGELSRAEASEEAVLALAMADQLSAAQTASASKMKDGAA
ncbi:MAG: sugar ABC transporter ATP-binding protein [Caldilineaceae bacterium]|jgi:L-arabinose transport system ATP-binding protein|nr:sugar ABC transporter ATP-binding protein [Caldilineaceae bacterium]